MKKKLYEKQDLNKVELVEGRKKSPYGIPDNIDIPYDGKQEVTWKKLENELKDYFDAINDAKDDLKPKLERWTAAIQQEPLEGDTTILENGCTLRSALTASNCTIISNNLYTALTIEPFFIASIRGDKELEARLRDYVNYKCNHQFDYRAFISQAVDNAVRTPFTVFVPERTREIVVHHDYRIFKEVDDFEKTYPKDSDTGLTDEQYARKVKDVQEDIKELGYHECHYDYEKVVNKSGIQAIHISNYYQFPWETEDVELAKLSGYKIEKTYDQLVRLERDGIIRKQQINLIQKRYIEQSNSENADEVKEQEQYKQGIKSTEEAVNYKTKIYPVCRGLVRLDLEDSGLEKDYEFWYMLDENILLRLAPYISHYKKRNMFKVRIGKMCIPEQLENSQVVLDTVIRQLLDGNALANCPETTMSQTSYDKLARSDEDFKHKVGKIWKLVQGDMLPLQKEKPDINGSLAILRFFMEDEESRTGASRSAMGQVLPGDPDAPGIKTMALLQRSDRMINRYLDEMRPGFDEAMKHLVKQDIQYMKDDVIELERQDNLGNEIESEDIDREALKFDEDKTRFLVRTQRADDNEALRKQESRQELELMAADPMFANRPNSKRILWRNYLINSDRWSVDEINALIPSEEQLRAELIEIQKEALKAKEAEEKQQAMLSEEQKMAEQREEQIDEVIKSQTF